MTNFTMPNNICSMKLALKLVSDLAVVRAFHGDGPRTPPRCLEGGGQEKKFQITNSTIHNNICSMKFALKSVVGLAYVPDTL